MRTPVWKGAAKSLIIGVRKVYANRQAWRQMEQREKRIAGLGEFWALVREDLHYNGGILWPGFQALAVYRFGVWKDGIAAKPLRIPFTIVYRLAYVFVRNFYGIELPLTTRIGRRFVVGHQHGIIIHNNAVIGDDCVVRQGVTIGAGVPTRGVWVGHIPAPKLGKRVEIGANATLIGAISVGDGVRIGPNAVVMTNVPAGAIVTAPLSRIMLPPKRKPKPAAAAADGRSADGSGARRRTRSDDGTEDRHMNLNVTPTDPAALEAIGQEHLAARRYAAAADAFEAAAAMSERPAGELALKLARASLEAGRPAAAAAALVGIVDSSTSFRTWAGAAGLIARCPEETWPGLRHRLRAGLVGTWTTNTFAPLLRLAAARHGIALDIDQPPFGQYFNATLDPGSELLAAVPDVLVLAPDQRALGLRPWSDTPAEHVAAELDRWTGVWEALRRSAAPTLVQLGFAAPGGDPLGHHGAGHPATRKSVSSPRSTPARGAGGGGGRRLRRRRDAAAREGGRLVRPARLVHGEAPLRAGCAAGARAPCRGGARRPARAVAPRAGSRPRQHALGRGDRRRRARRHRARAGRRGRGLRRLPGGAEGALGPRHRARRRLEERPEVARRPFLEHPRCS